MSTFLRPSDHDPGRLPFADCLPLVSILTSLTLLPAAATYIMAFLIFSLLADTSCPPRAPPNFHPVLEQGLALHLQVLEARAAVLPGSQTKT